MVLYLVFANTLFFRHPDWFHVLCFYCKEVDWSIWRTSRICFIVDLILFHCSLTISHTLHRFYHKLDKTLLYLMVPHSRLGLPQFIHLFGPSFSLMYVDLTPPTVEADWLLLALSFLSTLLCGHVRDQLFQSLDCFCLFFKSPNDILVILPSHLEYWKFQYCSRCQFLSRNKNVMKILVHLIWVCKHSDIKFASNFANM